MYSDAYFRSLNGHKSEYNNFVFHAAVGKFKLHLCSLGFRLIFPSKLMRNVYGVKNFSLQLLVSLINLPPLGNTFDNFTRIPIVQSKGGHLQYM